MMFSFARNVAAVAAGLVLVASVATAGLPDASTSTVPDNAIGHHSQPAVAGGNIFPFQVVVRDINSAPVAGATVALSFGTSVDATTAYNPQFASGNGVVVCPAITQVTDGSGIANFTDLYFGGFDVIEITANGVPLKMVEVTSVDVNNDGQVNVLDLAIFDLNFQNFPANYETDWNLDNVTNVLDLAILDLDLQAGGPVVATFCP